MPRGAQVIYPKDLGPILMLADIYPGVRVLESGVGLGGAQHDDAAGRRRHRRLRAAGGLRGQGPGERRRRSSARRPSGATTSSCATATRASTRPTSTASCSTCPSRGGSWSTPRRRCAPGGILLRLHAEHPQATQVREALDDRRRGSRPDTLEVLQRTWHVEGQAVRPDHRMVAHTGFLTTARFLSG